MHICNILIDEMVVQMYDDELLMKQRSSRKLASAIHQKGLNQMERPATHTKCIWLGVDCELFTENVEHGIV